MNEDLWTSLSDLDTWFDFVWTRTLIESIIKYCSTVELKNKTSEIERNFLKYLQIIVQATF